MLLKSAGKILFICAAITILFSGCRQWPPNKPSAGVTTIVFKHGKIAGNAAAFRSLLDRFEREHPGIRVRDESLPASTDEQHQFYAVNLESRSSDFDVLSLDVIWVPEFARAGWLRDVSRLFAPGEDKAFFPGPIEAVTFDARRYALPWYIDAGVLYFRTDLLAQYGKPVPETWQELAETAQEIAAKEKDLYGFLWQGKQYEGLVCVALEFIWGNGGDILAKGRPVIASRENAEALSYMRSLIAGSGVTPQLVTTATEEPTRQLFGSGRAVFMRNWPYAWTLYNAPGSALAGKVGLAELPAFPGHRPVSTLGGWQLGVNAFSHYPEAAEQLVLFLSSEASQKELARTVGYKPARRALYKDPDLLRLQPDLGQLYSVFMRARPRPVTPYYLMITAVLQPEFSAIVAGIREPRQALASAQKQVEHLLEAGP